MGLFSRRMKDPVRGTAQVVGASVPPTDTTDWSNCSLDLVVKAQGMQPYAKKLTSWKTPTSKWPFPGQTLPVTIDRANPDKVKIEWDDVQKSSDRAFEHAQQVAERMSEGGTDTGLPATLPQGTREVIPPEAAAIVEQLKQAFPGAMVSVDKPVEIDLTGKLGKLAELGQLGEQDRVAQLERLAKLHADGALTDEEFAAEKKRILGS